MSRIPLTELAKLDEESANTLIEEVDDNYTAVLAAKGKILKDYLVPLDKVIERGWQLLKQPEILTEDLNRLVLEIPLAQHYIFSRLAELNSKEVVMKSIKKELYTNTYLKSDGNAKEREMLATMDTKQETLVLEIYDIILEEVKEKSKVSWELLNAAKYVLRQKISEGEFNRSDTGRPIRY